MLGFRVIFLHLFLFFFSFVSSFSYLLRFFNFLFYFPLVSPPALTSFPHSAFCKYAPLVSACDYITVLTCMFSSHRPRGLHYVHISFTGSSSPNSPRRQEEVLLTISLT